MSSYAFEGLTLEEMKEDRLPAVLDIYNHYVRTSNATFHIAELGIEDMRGLVFHSDPRCRTFVLLDPASTGRGLGAKALRFVERFAAGQGFHALLALVTEENVRSARAKVSGSISYKWNHWAMSPPGCRRLAARA